MQLEPLVLPELPALTEPRAQLVLPACPVPPELQGQEQLVPRALQEPG